MNIAISNIAWRKDEDEAVAQLLGELGLDKIEIAPTRLFDVPLEATDTEIAAVVRWWKERGISLVAGQSLLFGTENLNIFGSAEVREQTKQYLMGIIELAGKLGLGPLVFGSPKNRLIGEMNSDEAMEIARDFFTVMGEAAQANGTTFCIEPNPIDYSCDFVTNAQEGIDFVRMVNNPGFRLHLDIAGMTLAGDDISAMVRASKDVLAHSHISAPMLGDVPDDSVDYDSFFSALNEIGFTGMRSIEMRPMDGSNLERVRAAVEFAQNSLGTND